MTVDPAQSAEIDLLDEVDLAAAAAAAATSTTLPDEEALALEAPLVRLGAMACARRELGVCARERDECGEKEKFGNERDG